MVASKLEIWRFERGSCAGATKRRVRIRNVDSVHYCTVMYWIEIAYGKNDSRIWCRGNRVQWCAEPVVSRVWPNQPRRVDEKCQNRWAPKKHEGNRRESNSKCSLGCRTRAAPIRSGRPHQRLATQSAFALQGQQFPQAFAKNKNLACAPGPSRTQKLITPSPQKIKTCNTKHSRVRSLPH